jgi:hypothetical protein
MAMEMASASIGSPTEVPVPWLNTVDEVVQRSVTITTRERAQLGMGSGLDSRLKIAGVERVKVPSTPVCLEHDVGLAVPARVRDAGCMCLAIVIDSTGPDHGPNRIAVTHSIRQSFKVDGADSFLR